MTRFALASVMLNGGAPRVDSADWDVIVVGAGNAATCAALSARENGATVLMLEVAPEDQRGGNSAFTGGAFRVVYHGGEDLARLIPDMNKTELNDVDFGTYTEEQYFEYGPADPVSLRLRPDRDPDPQQLCRRRVDA